MKNTALVVVDVQESFRHRPYWSDENWHDFIDNIQMLIDGCRLRRMPIVQIFHIEDRGAFSMESGWVVAMAPLSIRPDIAIYKRFHSAFAGTALAGWLNQRAIHRVIVAGIRTEECCETTARHASDLGFEVDFITEATLTFAISHPRTGRIFTPSEIKERTELVLSSGEFARILSVENILAAL